jgi:hypothetical protein
MIAEGIPIEQLHQPSPISQGYVKLTRILESESTVNRPRSKVLDPTGRSFPNFLVINYHVIHEHLENKNAPGRLDLVRLCCYNLYAAWSLSRLPPALAVPTAEGFFFSGDTVEV